MGSTPNEPNMKMKQAQLTELRLLNSYSKMLESFPIPYSLSLWERAGVRVIYFAPILSPPKTFASVASRF
jgi:hypothetical protein